MNKKLILNILYHTTTNKASYFKHPLINFPNPSKTNLQDANLPYPYLLFSDYGTTHTSSDGCYYPRTISCSLCAVRYGQQPLQRLFYRVSCTPHTTGVLIGTLSYNFATSYHNLACKHFPWSVHNQVYIDVLGLGDRGNRFLWLGWGNPVQRTYDTKLTMLVHLFLMKG